MSDFISTLNSYLSSKNIISLSLNNDLRTQVESRTEFLNSYYSKIPLKTRVFVILNEITEATLPKCKCGCEKVSAIDITYPENGFREYSGPECSRKSKTIPKSVKDKLEDYQWLYNERIIQQKSIEHIAEFLGVSTIPVVKYLKQHGLHQTFDARKIDKSRLSILENHDLMYNYYETQNLTLRDIAKIIKCSSSIVIKYLKLHNISIKNKNQYERKINKHSKEENQLYEYVKSIENSEVSQGNRKILNGKEIDILISRKNIGIEYNGIYSHLYRKNESNKAKIKGEDYHLGKTLVAKSKGINLYHFYSSECNDEPDKIKNFIRRKLHLNTIIEVCNSNIIATIEDSHRVTLSLMINGFSLARMNIVKTRNTIFIVEYNVNSDITLKNGFIQLLRYLKENYKVPIYCKIDRRFGEGFLYTSYGFKISKILRPRVFYTDNSYNKLHKHKIPNIINYKIYDCGYLLLKYE